jgi:hypothetical protein
MLTAIITSAGGFGILLVAFRRLRRRKRRRAPAIISRLPSGFAVSNRENLDHRALRQTDLAQADKIAAIYARRTELAQEAERACRQQTAALTAEEVRDLAKARADLLASMTPEERGFFASAQAARAEAEARIAGKCEAAEREIADLQMKVSCLKEQTAAVEGERNFLRRQVRNLAEELARK